MKKLTVLSLIAAMLVMGCSKKSDNKTVTPANETTKVVPGVLYQSVTKTTSAGMTSLAIKVIYLTNDTGSTVTDQINMVSDDISYMPIPNRKAGDTIRLNSKSFTAGAYTLYLIRIKAGGVLADTLTTISGN